MLINQNQITVNGIAGTPVIVDANGRVGIGTTTPTETLVVKGDGARITVESADMEVAMLGRRGSSGAALDSGYLRLRKLGVTIDGVVIDTDGSSWFNGGNVGIGTESPSYPLHISGTGHKRLKIEKTDAGGDADIQISSPNDSTGWVLFHDRSSGNNSGVIKYVHSTNNMHFRTNDVDDRLVISGDGYVTMPNQPHIFGTPHNGTEASSGQSTLFRVKTSRGLSFSNNRVTVSVAGVYMITYQTICQTNTGRYDTAVKVNGSTVTNGLNEENGTGYHQRTHSFCMYLNANDYITWHNARYYSNGSNFDPWTTASVTLLG